MLNLIWLLNYGAKISGNWDVNIWVNDLKMNEFINQSEFSCLSDINSNLGGYYCEHLETNCFGSFFFPSITVHLMDIRR